MALRGTMRHLLLISVFLLSGCATLDKIKESDTPPTPESSVPTLAAGECGLFIWTADADKIFTLFSSETDTALYKNGEKRGLTEKNPSLSFKTDRQFMDASGAAYNLTLLSPQDIEGGIRYKAGRLVTLDDEGWERVTPIVGLYACQPLI